ncbi:MAG: FtsX-like permease family protein [Luteitalea sp.]|nr:FtsX-like permease family protein [Luteitalea sp.]
MPLFLRSVANGPSPLRYEFERPLWTLAAIAALVLFIAGSNVANLLLARTAAPEREMSLRLSIGAGRGRLIQQMLVESAIVAGGIGLLFAAFAAPVVVGMLASAEDPVRLDLRMDWRLVAFVGGLTLLTTALFGLAPALRASSVAPITALKTGSERSGTRGGVVRPFVRRDMVTARSTALVVNETFARRYFGSEPAVGRRIAGRFDDAVREHEVVGVVADTKYDLRKPAAPTLYILLPPRSAGTIHVRVTGEPAVFASRLREEIAAATPLLRVTTVTSQSAVVGQTLLRERLLALLAGFFAAVGLVLTAVGLYGVLSYSVVRRTREIGIRVALGARQAAVVRAVLEDAGGATLVGAACGLAGGLYVSRFVKALLFEVTPLDF